MKTLLEPSDMSIRGTLLTKDQAAAELGYEINGEDNSTSKIEDGGEDDKPTPAVTADLDIEASIAAELEDLKPHKGEENPKGRRSLLRHIKLDIPCGNSPSLLLPYPNTPIPPSPSSFYHPRI